MKKGMKKFIFWTPRILSILLAAFVSIFAFDVFTPDVTFWHAFIGFLIHLIPVYLIVIMLILAWRWEFVGTLGSIGLGVAYVIMTDSKEFWVSYIVFLVPLTIIGTLFLLGWIHRKEIRH